MLPCMLDNVSYVTSLMFVIVMFLVSCPKPGCVLHTEVTAFIFFINFPELRKSVEEKIFFKKKEKMLPSSQATRFEL